MDESLLRAEVDRLYALPRDEFVAERDRRVKALRADGHRDEAAALGQRRKPTIPAWAVDQLPRRHPEQVDALLGAADGLRRAQGGNGGDVGAGNGGDVGAGNGGDADVGNGGDADAGLRDAAEEFRGRVAALRSRAEGVIAEAGSTPSTHLDDVERTLTAAADPEHHDTLRRGVFERPLPAPGFGAAAGPPVGTPSQGGKRAGAAADDREQRRRTRERRRRLERDRRNLESSRERQQRSVERAQDEAERLRERAERAARQVSNEAQALEGIDAELSAVEEELDQLPGRGPITTRSPDPP